MKNNTPPEAMKLDRRKLPGIAAGSVAATSFGPLGLAGAADLPAQRLANYDQASGFGDLVPDPKGRLALPAVFP